jgi:hypothetical protein
MDGWMDTEWCRYFSDLPWFTVFIYVSVFVAFLAAFYLEYKDLFCPNGQMSRIGNGAAYNKGKVYKDDSVETILQKIRISSRYDESSVYWRRSIIFTVTVLFSVLLVALRRLPTAYEVLTGFVIIYMFTYLFLNYYQDVISVPASKQVTEATKILEKMY